MSTVCDICIVSICLGSTLVRPNGRREASQSPTRGGDSFPPYIQLHDRIPGGDTRGIHGTLVVLCGTVGVLQQRLLVHRPAREVDDREGGVTRLGWRVLELARRLVPRTTPDVQAKHEHSFLGRVPQLRAKLRSLSIKIALRSFG